MQVDFRNPLVGLVVALGFERRAADNQFISEHSQAPNVNGGVVFPPGNHFRGQVVQRAAQCFAPRGGRVHRPPKIGDFYQAPVADQQILRFDVPVDNVFAVAVVQGVGKLLD